MRYNFITSVNGGEIGDSDGQDYMSDICKFCQSVGYGSRGCEGCSPNPPYVKPFTFPPK